MRRHGIDVSRRPLRSRRFFDRKSNVGIFLLGNTLDTDDPLTLAFVSMLNSMRFGVLDSATVKTFSNLTREVVYDDGLVPTELYVLQKIILLVIR